MKCKRHPKYKGLGKPRNLCETCWAIWFGLAKICINCGCGENLNNFQGCQGD